MTVVQVDPQTGRLVNRLRTFRESRGWSQGELGRRAGIDKVRMHHIEVGTGMPDRNELRRLTMALHTDPELIYPANGAAHVERTQSPPGRSREGTTAPTQTARVLELLRAHGAAGVTPLEALEVVGSFRLGARIWELRKAGHEIHTDLVTTVGGARVARYVLEEW